LKTYKKLNKKKNITILDAVCPFVKKAQNIVKKLNEDKLVEGKSILIIGEKKHPEIAALVSYSTKCVLVENVKEAKKFVSASKIINIVSQTTQTQENFGSIVKVLKKRYKVEVHNTICRATLDRQSSAAKLSKQVDLMIVIGGKNSGNTARLTQICSQNAKTIHIETEEDLKFSQLKNMNKIGITAGASTPNWIIKGVKRRIKEFMKVQLC
jgi:4-hydroxy-3-methylbut-2-enyl diphosphate reductase